MTNFSLEKRVPKNRNFPTLVFLRHTNKKFSQVDPIPRPTWYDSFKKYPKAHWDQAQDCHVHATNGAVQHAPKRARLFPFEGRGGKGARGDSFEFWCPCHVPSSIFHMFSIIPKDVPQHVPK
jgi:hypothetical protein